MKKLVALFAFVLMISSLFGQSEHTVTVDHYTINEAEGTVQISIKTTESFIAGANRYVLHIGGRHFLRSLHPEGQLNEIVFFIPMIDFENIAENANMVLVYGLYHENTMQDNEGSQINGFIGKKWNLGAFMPK